jgi:hypothetical protein
LFVLPALRGWLALAAIAACGISLAFRGNDLVILGAQPTYGPLTVSTVPNLRAAGPLLWVPGLDQGWDPQGLAAADGSLLISAYRSDRFGANRGPCRVFRLDPASGHETGHFDVPPPCGHAGGLAYAGDGSLYITDTHTLFEVDLDSAFGNRTPLFRIFPLGPGLKGAFAASGQGEIWIGSYEEDQPGRLLKYERRVLEALPDRATLTRELAASELSIPSYAQGAAISFGKLWISRSELAWGSLEKLDLSGGRVVERYPAPGGIEGIAFDDAGGLWAVSEAGARHFPGHYPFFPVIFRLDLNRMTRAAPGN